MAGRFFVYPFFWPASATGASPAWEALRPKAEMGSYEAVSYTHLDVYKRQAKISPATLGTKAMLPGVGRPAVPFTSPSWAAAGARDSSVEYTAFTCLLYTSRCV